MLAGKRRKSFPGYGTLNCARSAISLVRFEEEAEIGRDKISIVRLKASSTMVFNLPNVSLVLLVIRGKQNVLSAFGMSDET